MSDDINNDNDSILGTTQGEINLEAMDMPLREWPKELGVRILCKLRNLGGLHKTGRVLRSSGGMLQYR